MGESKLENIEKVKDDISNKSIKNIDIIKSIIYTAIGVIVFFIPININDYSTTLIYHISNELQENNKELLSISCVIFIIIGCTKRIYLGKKNKKNKGNILNYIRFLSIILLVELLYSNKNIFFINDNICLITEQILLNIITILPIASIFMTFILDYGAIEVIELYCHKFSKRLFKLSGKTILNIFMYIFVDYFCGLFMTERLYKKGKIKQYEACMLVLHFSIVPVYISKYILNELNIDKLEFVVIATIIILLSNIILCRTYPRSLKKKSYYIKTSYKEPKTKDNTLLNAISSNIDTREKGIFKNIISDLENAINLILNILPDIIIFMYLGEILINNTAIIEIVNDIIAPFIELLKYNDIKYISEFISLNFYNNIVALESISSDMIYNSKLIIALIAILGTTSITTNIAYLKYSLIQISKKEIIIAHIQRIIIIIPNDYQIH